MHHFVLFVMLMVIVYMRVKREKNVAMVVAVTYLKIVAQMVMVVVQRIIFVVVLVVVQN